MSGIYSLTSGAKAQQRLVETTANNLANANTIGYKTDKNVFKEYLGKAVGTDIQSEEEQFTGSEFLSPYGKGHTSYVKTDDTLVDFTQGHLKLTENKFDLAIDGEGFFSVDTPQGMKYTRDGTFSRDNEGYLTDKSGHHVIGENGKILVLGDDFNVLESGVIEVDQQFVDKIRVVSFEQPGKLNKTGDNYFMPKSVDQTPTSMSSPVIKQGMLESSATNVTSEMVNLITANRLYEVTQKGIKLMDEINSKSNQIARL